MGMGQVTYENYRMSGGINIVEPDWTSYDFG